MGKPHMFFGISVALSSLKTSVEFGVGFRTVPVVNGIWRRNRKKDQTEMSRLRKVLDPSKTGKDAENLEKTLLKLVVGQDEAIEQIVNIYQMHVTGLCAPGRP